MRRTALRYGQALSKRPAWILFREGNRHRFLAPQCARDAHALNDMQFVNGTFEFNPTTNTFELAESILSAPAAHFEHVQG